MDKSRERSNPHRLYRNRERGMIAGVCAGLADYFGFNLRALRVVVVISALFFMPFVLLSYFALAILLPARPQGVPVDEEKEDFWRNVSNAPAEVFSKVRHRFRELDLRLQRMEAFVTSREFEIDGELGRGPGAADGANG